MSREEEIAVSFVFPSFYPLFSLIRSLSPVSSAMSGGPRDVELSETCCLYSR